MIGKVVEDSDELGGSSDDEWWFVTLWSPWGLIDVWLRDDDPAGDTGDRHPTGVVRPFTRCE